MTGTGEITGIATASGIVNAAVPEIAGGEMNGIEIAIATTETELVAQTEIVMAGVGEALVPDPLTVSANLNRY